jgi:hypothetical protein
VSAIQASALRDNLETVQEVELGIPSGSREH